jgi:membrane-bound lytic murein transglycosylase D
MRTTGVDEGAGVVRRPTVWLALLGSLALYATVALADARGGAALGVLGSAAPEPVEALHAIETLSSSEAHPVLPPALAALDDALLTSPMLHHPPFAAEVERWIDRWSGAFSEWMPTYLGRMAGFERMVDETLTARGLPRSLRYLPVIESGYSPSAVSSASAVGMWQFMAATAGDFGIEVSPLVDDRRDPFVSTEAAADYLLELRERFGSWFLALAAYNAGPDRIERLLERYLPHVERSDAVYWALRDVLPKETADFVPNFLGAVVVASDPIAFGYEPPTPTPFAFDVVAVRGSVSFETVARAAGVSRDEIARLNPEYLRGMTPPGREVELRLPPGRVAAFRAYFAEDGEAPES